MFWRLHLRMVQLWNLDFYVFNIGRKGEKDYGTGRHERKGY